MINWLIDWLVFNVQRYGARAILSPHMELADPIYTTTPDYLGLELNVLNTT